MEKFKWTDERVCEVSRMICDERDKSEVWTSNFDAEMNIIQKFKNKIFYEKVIKSLSINYLHNGESDEKLMVMSVNDFDKFINEIIEYNER